MMRAGDHIGDDFGILRIWDARFEDANDCRRAITKAAEANGFAEDRGVLVKSGRPETISENDDAGSLRTVVLRPNQATEHAMKAHHVEKRATDHTASNLTRLTDAYHSEIYGGGIAKRAQRFHARAPVLLLMHGKPS